MISARLALALFVLPGTVIAQHIPVINWTVPPYRAAATSGGLVPMVDISPGVAFTAIAPCRAVDTREPTSQYFGASTAFSIRTFDLNDGAICGFPGIPDDVEAYSLNIGAIAPPADGFLKAWRTGTHEPSTSVLNFLAGEVIANAAIVPAGTGGAINVLVNVGPTHIYIDINGYFTADQNPGQSFVARSSDATPAIIGENTSSLTAGTGLLGILSSSNPGGGSAAVRGISNATNNLGYAGSFSSTGTGISLNVEAFSGTGVVTQGVIGLIGQGSFIGASGTAVGSAGLTYGLRGQSASVSNNSAGIFGHTVPAPDSSGASLPRAGVRGESQEGIGVVGLSHVAGVSGLLVAPVSGTVIAEGRLGIDFLGDALPWGVFALGDIGASGTKHFVDPHPSDPSKAISYVSLEGPEAGTYFRGRARFQSGIARITVPEHFRLVTDSDGLSVQVTPIGAMATVAVLRVDLNEIVVQSSRDVEFFYVVQGVREAFRNVDPVISAAPFSPRTPDARIPAYLSEEQKRRLIANGTYNADGTVNVETARRLGWDRMWQARSGPPEAAPIP